MLSRLFLNPILPRLITSLTLYLHLDILWKIWKWSFKLAELTDYSQLWHLYKNKNIINVYSMSPASNHKVHFEWLQQ